MGHNIIQLLYKQSKNLNCIFAQYGIHWIWRWMHHHTLGLLLSFAVVFFNDIPFLMSVSRAPLPSVLGMLLTVSPLFSAGENPIVGGGGGTASCGGAAGWMGGGGGMDACWCRNVCLDWVWCFSEACIWRWLGILVFVPEKKYIERLILQTLYMYLAITSLHLIITQLQAHLAWTTIGLDKVESYQ